jgi:hypothetical protein
VAAAFLAACSSQASSASAEKTDFARLAASPEMYSGKTVTIQGFWFDGFEIVVLAEGLEPSGFADGNVRPGGTMIWVQGGLPEDVSKQLSLQPDNPTGYPAHYGRVELTGDLEYGGKYGHMDAYRYRLTVQRASLISPSP